MSLADSETFILLEVIGEGSFGKVWKAFAFLLKIYEKTDIYTFFCNIIVFLLII